VAKTRDKLNRLDNSIKRQWSDLESSDELSTRDKLDRLVRSRLKERKTTQPVPNSPAKVDLPAVLEREYSYPAEARFGAFTIGDLACIRAADLSILTGNPEWKKLSPSRLLYFDTETTGLSGGTGTIPFMLGFGFLEGETFQVRIFTLSDLTREKEFLETVDRFLDGLDFCATVTYNGKCFDFPLMETRYILQRRKFPLLSCPHLDFLYPARVLWRHTYPSRRLGFLGDILLGLSREEDVDGSLIPHLYFRFLRNGDSSMLEKVMEHNALDLVGLAMLLRLGAGYLEDVSLVHDEGEVMGTARLLESSGYWEQAVERLTLARSMACREEVQTLATRRLSRMKKKQKLYSSAIELWEELRAMGDAGALRELSIHYEHRERDFHRALKLVQDGLSQVELSTTQRLDLEKRLQRLQEKIRRVESDGGP